MENPIKPVSVPRGAAEANRGHWLKSLRQGLQVASQLVVASPLGLPAKVVAVARYVSLVLGIWDAVDRREEDEVAETSADDAP